MTEKYNRREKEHLFNLILRRSGDTPNFAILIGAGASISSGAKPACQMIDEWRHQLHNQSRSTDPIGKWLEKQDWFNDDDEYSMLFEKVYDQPAQRRNYVEECVKDARPSWGYIYLSNLIAYNFFNVIFTPNFDDLINEACSSIDHRPIVCAHDSAVSTIRVTSKRAKIIKLHGDFLYDTIKNTLKETDSLEKNMQDKFLQFSKEYGLVVVGYGGNDASIMDVLTSLVRSSGYFPHGVYWCLKKDAKIGRKLDRFLQRENVYLVEIDGFDELMAELHEHLGLTLPDLIRDPYKATTNKLNRFTQMTGGISNKIIEKDMGELQVKIKAYEGIFTTQTPLTGSYVPFKFLAATELREGRPLKAAEYLEKELLGNPSDTSVLRFLVLAYLFGENDSEALRVAEQAKKQFPKKYIGYSLMSFALFKEPEKSLSSLEEGQKFAENQSEIADLLTEKSYVLLRLRRYDEVLSLTEKLPVTESSDYAIAKINRCFALKGLGRTSEAVKLADELLLRPEVDSYNRALIYALLDKKKEMITELKKAYPEDGKSYLTHAVKHFVAFEAYREDADVMKAISSS